jgi:fluoride ion exporter CrcB/FEX
VASIRQRRCISNHGMLMVLLLLQLSVWSLAMVAAIEQRRCRSNRCCGGAHHQWRSVLNQGMNGRRTTCSSFQVQSRSSFALKERVHFFITWKASHVRVSCCLREWVMCFFFVFLKRVFLMCTGEEPEKDWGRLVWEESTGWTATGVMGRGSCCFNGDGPVEGGAYFFECGRWWIFS